MPAVEDKVYFSVGLDAITMSRLIKLAEACAADPSVVMASLVRDVLEDDAIAHGEAVGSVLLQ